MKKLLCVMLLVFACAGIACAEVKIELDNYQCVLCNKTFLAFKGDPVDYVKMEDQLSRIFLLSDRSKHVEERCVNGSTIHAYKKNGTRNVNIELIAQNMNRIIVVKGGGALGQKLLKWKCLLCDKEFYGFGGINMNIRDWGAQPDHIKSLKGMRGIDQCSGRSKGYYGHVFKLVDEGPMNSYDFANSSILDKMYYVR